MLLGLLQILIGGFCVGLASSVTVGPVAVLCIQRTLSKGYLSGIFSGLGVAVAENEHPADEKSQNSPKYIVLGGDYFTKEDFADLEPVNSFKIGKLGDVEVEAECDVRSDSVENQMIGGLGEDDGLDDFYTETLARIYAEQGYYEEAIKVYAKLILLYPEKSAYFATLVNDVKSKNN